jgi:hypothetical protein
VAQNICLRPPISLHERPEAHDGAAFGGVVGSIDVLLECNVELRRRGAKWKS